MTNGLFTTQVVDPLREFFLSFGMIGAIVWIVLKILLIAMPVIITVAFYVVWERKLIGWMHVRHGPDCMVGKGILQAFADVLQAAVQGSDPARARGTTSCSSWRR